MAEKINKLNEQLNELKMSLEQAKGNGFPIEDIVNQISLIEAEISNKQEKTIKKSNELEMAKEESAKEALAAKTEAKKENRLKKEAETKAKKYKTRREKRREKRHRRPLLRALLIAKIAIIAGLTVYRMVDNAVTIQKNKNGTLAVRITDRNEAKLQQKYMEAVWNYQRNRKKYKNEPEKLAENEKLLKELVAAMKERNRPQLQAAHIELGKMKREARRKKIEAGIEISKAQIDAIPLPTARDVFIRNGMVEFSPRELAHREMIMQRYVQLMQDKVKNKAEIEELRAIMHKRSAVIKDLKQQARTKIMNVDGKTVAENTSTLAKLGRTPTEPHNVIEPANPDERRSVPIKRTPMPAVEAMTTAEKTSIKSELPTFQQPMKINAVSDEQCPVIKMDTRQQIQKPVCKKRKTGKKINIRAKNKNKKGKNNNQKLAKQITMTPMTSQNYGKTAS